MPVAVWSNRTMTDAELFQARAQKWRLDGQPVRTLEDARAFLESVGFCLMYPMRPALLAPTFIGAWVGADDKLPARQHAYNDPRAIEATELMVRALRDRSAFEAPLLDENNAFLLAPSVFPYFYSLVGERNPKHPPASGPRSPYSPLACDAFEIIRRSGPISKTKLGETLGGSVSNAGLDRALAHRALDETFDAVAGIRERPPWRPIPPAIRAANCGPSCASRGSITRPRKDRCGMSCRAGRRMWCAKGWGFRCRRRSQRWSRSISIA